MRGYIEQIDFETHTINGWYSDISSSAGTEIQVIAYLGGIEVGSSITSGTRSDLIMRVSKNPNLLFSIQLDSNITAVDILTQKFCIMAAAGRVEQTVPITVSLMYKLMTSVDKKALVGVAEPAYIPGKTIPHSANGAKSGLLSPVLLPIGLESADKSARIGQMGNLFLTGGTNEIEKIYSESAPSVVERHADNWKSLFDNRSMECSKRNIRYIQTVLPDKLTTLRHLAPFKIDGPTPILSATENQLESADYYVSSTKELDNWSLAEPPFITSDSHMSATGSQKVFVNLVRSFSAQLVEDAGSIKIDTPNYEIGDLSRRFFHLPIYSESLVPSPDDIMRYSYGLNQSMNRPADKGHIGTRYSWTNTSAPDKSTVLVFGSSSFGHGRLGRELNWWGKHFFANFHFVWSPEFNWEIVDEIGPDVIIGQTVERFMRILPKS